MYTSWTSTPRVIEWQDYTKTAYALQPTGIMGGLYNANPSVTQRPALLLLTYHNKCYRIE